MALALKRSWSKVTYWVENSLARQVDQVSASISDSEGAWWPQYQAPWRVRNASSPRITRRYGRGGFWDGDSVSSASVMEPRDGAAAVRTASARPSATPRA